MLRWQVLPTAEEAAGAAAALIGASARTAVHERGEFHVAMSGGSNTQLLVELARQAVPWPAGAFYQVDERVAPAGDPARNLVPLAHTLPDAAVIRPMPVEDPDLDAAAARYADQLPSSFDVVQLGVGDDGHTASLVPGDPVLQALDRSVAVTGQYRGHRRMTLTYPVLDRARLVVWLATGPAKSEPLRRLLARDEGIPAGRVRALDQIVVCDAAAAPRAVLT